MKPPRLSPPEPELVQIEKPVSIEKPIYGGAFLARVAGKAVFVPLTLPGEQARIRIVEDKRGYASAEATEITAPSADRVAPKCPHFGACGGCDYQHANYDAQLRFKRAVLCETLERAQIRIQVRTPDEIAVLSANPWAYRNRIRLAFDAAGNPGYRGRRSHGIVPIAECPIASPLLIRAAQAIAKILRHSSPAVQLSELSLFCNADETALLASLHLARPAKIQFDDLFRGLAHEIPELKGAELTIEDRATHQPRTLARSGATSLTYRAAGFDYRVDHGAFFQVNRWLLDPFVDAIVSKVIGNQRGSLAWDLFAGVGLFARQLASSFTRVVAVESAPSATTALAHNLNGTSATAVNATTFDFLRRTQRRQTNQSERPDLIVVDPPRTGLGAETTTLLANIAAPALVYVSCDPATLARDLRPLIASGYTIESITLADLFPQTFHLETIVHLRR
jgi:23S rRNA (uracil1939-C5)-methyltransferase